jgi:hypothetical protein
LNGLLGNEVSVMIINLSSVEEHAKSGKVRLVAAATEKRVPPLPGLAAVSETAPAFNTSVWFGLWGPGKMPPDLLAKIHADVPGMIALSPSWGWPRTEDRDQRARIYRVHRNVECDALIFGNRFVQVADLADEIRQCDVAETGQPPTLLYFSDPHNVKRMRKSQRESNNAHLALSGFQSSGPSLGLSSTRRPRRGAAERPSAGE